jgi:hypothetical protein
VQCQATADPLDLAMTGEGAGVLTLLDMQFLQDV